MSYGNYDIGFFDDGDIGTFMSAADFVSSNPDISPNPNPTSIDPVTRADPSRKVATPASQVNTTPVMTTPHPTLSQGKSTPFPSLDGKQQ